MDARTIIDKIQQGESSEDAETKKEIEKADAYLLAEWGQKPERPDFLDDFFEITKGDLHSTVNSCIKARNKPRLKDDLKKYKEGYFNEIIQNANDIKQKDDEELVMNVVCSKEGSRYGIACDYPDKGFGLENIYGFCTRGNSDKKAEDGQEGMYGIGIKSLFCFVTDFCIENNVRISLRSEGDGLLNAINIEDICISREPGQKPRTTLKFHFEYHPNDKKKNKHAGFHVEKMAEFIDRLLRDEDVDDYFLGNDMGGLLFDARALAFMDLRGTETGKGSFIKEIQFFSEDEAGIKKHKKTLKAKNRDISISDWLASSQGKQDAEWKKLARISDIMIYDISSGTDRKMKYLIFHYVNNKEPEKNLSIGYWVPDERCSPDEEVKDRLYATYFVAALDRPFLDVPTGCLVNTRAVNSSRSGLERENEKDPAILGLIKEKGRETIEDILYILKNRYSKYLEDENEKDDAKLLWNDVMEWMKCCSNVLCQMLYLYRNEQEEDVEGQKQPLSIFEGETACTLRDVLLNGVPFLPFYLPGYLYIYHIAEDDGVNWEAEMIEKNRPLLSTEEDCKKLYEVYSRCFVGEKCLIYGGEQYEKLPAGIKNLARFFIEELGNEKPENRVGKSWIAQLEQCLPILCNVKSLIERTIEKRTIGGHDFVQIMKFISEHEEDAIWIKQLVGRYEVNDSFNYMGDYSNKNIRNWLFQSEGIAEKDEEYKEACSVYEESYSDLKKLVRGDVYEVSYRKSKRDTGYSNRWWYKDDDWWKNKKKHNDNISKEEMETHSALAEVYEKGTEQFLSLLSQEVIFIGKLIQGYGEAEQFAHNLEKNICLDMSIPGRTDEGYAYWEKFRYFFIDFMSWYPIEDFKKFTHFCSIIDEYNKRTSMLGSAERPILKYSQKCRIRITDQQELREVFQWAASYGIDSDEAKKVKIDVASIKEDAMKPQNSRLIAFVQQLLKKEIHMILKEMQMPEKKSGHYIGYITNLQQDGSAGSSYRLFQRERAGSGFIELSSGEGSEGTAKETGLCKDGVLIIFYHRTGSLDEQRALADVMEHMKNVGMLKDVGMPGEMVLYIRNFIQPGNIRQLSSKDFNRYLAREDVSCSYDFERETLLDMEDCQKTDLLFMDDIFAILSGEMSYDGHCPICGRVPTLNIEGRKSASENRNSLVAIIPAKNNIPEDHNGKDHNDKDYNDKDHNGRDTIIYVLTVCCKSCFEEYKASLTSAELTKPEGSRFYQLTLKNTIRDGCREYDFNRKIKISPDNWDIIKKFNNL